jgi:SWI/SNF-related matrix-associated actin-dependent regulator 1 of chromatin subfamily A
MSEEEYRNAVNNLKARTAASIGEIARLRHKTALAKVPALAEHCKSMLEETDKIVIFAHHKDVIDEIKQSLSEYLPVSITGDISINERQESVDKFQSDDNCRVFIGSITAAGVGITLTAASTVIFAELDWVPGNLSQAEDRCHRIGQQDSVLVQHVMFENSIDAYLAQKIVSKQEIIEQAVDITKESASEPINEESELIINIIESDDY